MPGLAHLAWDRMTEGEEDARVTLARLKDQERTISSEIGELETLIGPKKKSQVN